MRSSNSQLFLEATQDTIYGFLHVEMYGLPLFTYDFITKLFQFTTIFICLWTAFMAFIRSSLFHSGGVLKIWLQYRLKSGKTWQVHLLIWCKNVWGVEHFLCSNFCTAYCKYLFTLEKQICTSWRFRYCITIPIESNGKSCNMVCFLLFILSVSSKTEHYGNRQDY